MESGHNVTYQIGMRQGWIKAIVLIFAGAMIIRALADRRPDKLYLMAVIAAIGVCAVAIGWLFAVRKRRHD